MPVHKAALHPLVEFTDVAANESDMLVSMELNKDQFIGTVRPSREIEVLHWFMQEPEDILIAPLMHNNILLWRNIPLVTKAPTARVISINTQSRVVLAPPAPYTDVLSHAFL